MISSLHFDYHTKHTCILENRWQRQAASDLFSYELRIAACCYYGISPYFFRVAHIGSRRDGRLRVGRRRNRRKVEYGTISGNTAVALDFITSSQTSIDSCVYSMAIDDTNYEIFSPFNKQSLWCEWRSPLSTSQRRLPTVVCRKTINTPATRCQIQNSNCFIELDLSTSTRCLMDNSFVRTVDTSQVSL